MVSSSGDDTKQKAGPKSKTKNEFYITCVFCTFSCLKDDEFKRHIDDNHKNDLFKFPCEICGFNAKGPKYLRQHKAESHANEATRQQLTESKEIIDNHSEEAAEKKLPVEDLEKELQTAVNEESIIEKISVEDSSSAQVMTDAKS